MSDRLKLAAVNAAEKVLERWTVGTSSQFCDESDWDAAEENRRSERNLCCDQRDTWRRTMRILLLLTMTYLLGCAARGEVRADADYTENQGARAGVHIAARW